METFTKEEDGANTVHIPHLTIRRASEFAWLAILLVSLFVVALVSNRTFVVYRVTRIATSTVGNPTKPLKPFLIESIKNGRITVFMGFIIIGIFTGHNPSAAAIKAVKDLIEYGVTLGKIQENYTLLGHRQTTSTSCPGDSLYQLIQTWPHWSSIW